MMILANIIESPWVYKIGWTLVHFLWQGAVLAVLLLLALRVLRRARAVVRYGVGCAVLLLMVLVPLVTCFVIEAPKQELGGDYEFEMEMPEMAFGEFEDTAVGPVEAMELPVVVAAEVVIPEPEPEPEVREPFLQRARAFLQPALPWLTLGWLVGVAVLSIWNLAGWNCLQRFKKKMNIAVSADLLTRMKGIADKMGVRRAVRMVESALINSPAVIGFIKPMILLPTCAITGLSIGQIEAIIAHELAHIKRNDYLVNPLQTVVEILGFYHPAVWWVSRKIRIEREHCCDDMAIAVTGDNISYAKALVNLAENKGQAPNLAVAARGGNFFQRIARLVKKDEGDNPSKRLSAVLAAVLIFAIAVPAVIAINSRNKPVIEGNEPTAAELIEDLPTSDKGTVTGPITFSSELPYKVYVGGTNFSGELIGQTGPGRSAIAIPNDVFWFVDPLFAGDITFSQYVAEIKSKNIPGVRFSNGKFTNDDLKLLSDLHDLKMLAISASDKITDISALSSLKSLKALKLSYFDGLTDLQPLSEMTSLEVLGLSRSANIKDISPLAKLKSLRMLILRNCDKISQAQIDNLLKQFPKGQLKTSRSFTSQLPLEVISCLPESHLLEGSTGPGKRAVFIHPGTWFVEPVYRSNVTWQQLIDVVKAEKIPGISWPGEIDNEQLTQLGQLPWLQYLQVKNCKEIDDISVLAKLTALENLSLSECSNLKDLSPLINLKALARLRMLGCDNLKDLSPLTNLNSLKSLSISDGTIITDISPLSQLDSLEILWLDQFNKLKDYSPLSDIVSLRALYVRKCKQFKDLTPLAGLTQLKKLLLPPDVTNEQLSWVIKTCPGLQELGIQYNNTLTDITPLAKLLSLKSLSIINCTKIT
ncbi:MAG: M48 family metalloprotease, partial [Phycisphaerae bacterium]|nr:M48 family metalloprotease [Phycisphaerae bacterium]